MGRYLALLLALILGSWIAFNDQLLPESAPLSTPATEFSGERAFADVNFLSAVPHPTGSVANANVRDAIVGRMLRLGFSPQVRPGVGVFQSPRAPDAVIAGQIENIVGVLPGRDRSAPALALMAHYDSVPGSPGAADDLMGVAAVLETARAIKARGTPARDVYLLITDGEEAGLLGANAFFRRDPLAERIGLVVNLEARGSAGRVQMFQTSPDNGKLIEVFQRTAQRPASSSLSVLIYDKMPNDTDLTEALKAGKSGLNYAIIGNQFDYHSPTATAANLDRGSLQDMGTQALAVASELAFSQQLPGRAGSAVYSSVFGDLVIAYPVWAGWVLLAAIAFLIALAVRWARHSGEFPAMDIVRGAGALAFAALSTAAVLEFARRLTGAEFGYLEQRFLLAQAQRWEWAIMLISLGVLMGSAGDMARGRRWMAAIPVLFGLACSAFGTFDMVGAVAGVTAGVIGFFVYNRPTSRKGAWAGVLLLGLLLAIVLQIAAPEAAYVIAWPLLVASLGAAATALSARRGVLGLALLTVLAALALGWEGGISHLAFLSMDVMALFSLQMVTAGLVLWPLAQPDTNAEKGLVVGGALLIMGFIITLFVRAEDPWTPRYPRITYVGFQVEADTGRTWRFAPASMDGSWTRQALGGTVQPRGHWSWRVPMLAAPGRPVSVATPATTLEPAADGAMRLTVAPPPGSRRLALQLRADKAARLLAVNGVPTDLALPTDRWVRVFWASPGAPIVMNLQPSAPGRLQVRYAATIDGWPAEAAPLPPRPADIMLWDDSDSTFVTGSHAYAW
ncbi:MAG: M20/M25/M40 family metallo-hydrolase [Phenylobacterium sp.]|uniref:M20/M25/M40 family metallo-hydrolase n=1 Tax=Phenylobacterium sp. TaxID=1871053 RepID=UPI0025D1C0F9|nr:M20/M25/M40 family metallo-hydrolase [Phenylobacterium sp.]MBI1199369.1 M20/M25/M40 family metallo-hydrolase [Phenylobacterium sp.]